jgi:hypothetical protein
MREKGRKNKNDEDNNNHHKSCSCILSILKNVPKVVKGFFIRIFLRNNSSMMIFKSAFGECVIQMSPIKYNCAFYWLKICFSVSS